MIIANHTVETLTKSINQHIEWLEEQISYKSRHGEQAECFAMQVCLTKLCKDTGAESAFADDSININ